MEEPESTSNKEGMDVEIAKLINRLNELYREAQLAQTEDDMVAFKSNIRAEVFKEDGDKHFCMGSFEDARFLYTLCLAYAEEDSEAIGHAYANRSAALFKLDFFEESLLDIDRALNSNYPEDKKKSLRERKERNLASKKAEQSRPLASSRTREVEAEWRNKLCNFHNPLIPGASDKIKLESNEKWGRHLVATKNINPGEVLTCQRFFTMVRDDGDMDMKYNVCSYCLLYHPALIPCPKCPLDMYCSDYCRTQALNSYHRIECRIFPTNDVRKNIVALRCLLVGTDQGAGLASLMKKISLQDIFHVDGNIDEFTEKPFSSDNYMFLLRLCRKFDKPLSDKVDFIPKIIIAMQKAGYFDYVSDHQQHEANVDPKADGYNNSESERDFDVNKTDKDISSKVLDSVEPVDESDDKKEHPDESKNEEKLIVPEHADTSTIVGTSFKNSDEQDVTSQEGVTEASEEPPSDSTTTQSKSSTEVTAPPLDSLSASSEANEQSRLKHKRETNIDSKDGNINESVYEKDYDISFNVSDSVEVAVESVDKKEDPDVDKNEDRPLVQEYEDSSRIVESNDKKEDPRGSENEGRPPEGEDSTIIVGEEFIKFECYYCKLCDLCLCYNPNISQDEMLRAHSRTPLHLERRSARNSDGQEVTTQKCVTATSLSETVEEPPSDSTSQPPESSAEISTAPLDSLPGSSDANKQKLVERQTYLTPRELYASFLLLNHRLSLENFTLLLEQFYDLDSAHKVYGYGACILYALINHSCDPNVVFLTRGQELAFYAVRPISKGEQIFVMYVPTYLFSPLQERLEKLSTGVGKFQFNCECEACVNKWPIYEDLRKMRPKFLFSDKKAAIKAIHKIKSQLKWRKNSTSRLEIIQIIVRLCEWLHINVKRPYVASAECERLLVKAMNHFYDTSSPIELTELDKKDKMLDSMADIFRSINL